MTDSPVATANARPMIYPLRLLMWPGWPLIVTGCTSSPPLDHRLERRLVIHVQREARAFVGVDDSSEPSGGQRPPTSQYSDEMPSEVLSRMPSRRRQRSPASTRQVPTRRRDPDPTGQGRRVGARPSGRAVTRGIARESLEVR